jgi:hypothetical protein
MVQAVESRTQVRVTRATRRILGLPLFLVVSLLLHVAVFPAHLMQGLLSRMLHGGDSAVLEDHPTIIPIDLEEDDKPSAGLPPEDEFVEPTEIAKTKGVVDAGAADTGSLAGKEAGADAADAGSQDDSRLDDAAIARAQQDSGTPGQDGIALLKPAPPDAAPVDAAGVADAAADARPFSPIADPVALAGQAGRIAGTPNVSAFIYSERIRRHQLAAHFTPTLTRHPQWNSFFAGTGLDPVQDVDRIWLAGPQFRDTSKVVAVLRYRVPEAKVRAAVGAVVQRSGANGAWLDAGVPAAKGVADRAARVFVMSAPNMLVVVPPDGLEQALRVRSIPGGGRNELFVLYLRSARNGLAGIPITVPETLENLRFAIESASDGGVNLRVDVHDRDAAAAQEHARKITEDLERLAFISIAFTQVRLFDPVTFYAQGDHIRAETHMNERQLRTALSAIAAWIESATRPRTAPSTP